MDLDRVGAGARPEGAGAPPTPPARLRGLDVRQSPGQPGTPGERSHPAPMRIDFSHGDVTAFLPADSAMERFVEGVADGGHTAYTQYRGNPAIRGELAPRLAALLGSPVDPEQEVIITPGTQAGLFLALSALVETGSRVGIVEPDYFANRRIVRYLGAEPIGIRLQYADPDRPAALDLDQLRDAVDAGVRVVCLSNPNNPTGAVLPPETVRHVAEICRDAGAVLVIDQLYCRLVFSGAEYTHLRSLPGMADNCLTLLGPSKTESLSGFRVGVAVGPGWLIERMESILSIVSLRAGGYSQSVLRGWLAEPQGWLEDRIDAHQMIRDAVVGRLRAVDGVVVRPTEGGSYLFPRLPRLTVSPERFIRDLREEEGIIVTRGPEFGPGFDDCFRINFSQDAVRTGETIDRLARLIEQRAAGGSRQDKGA
jgi:aspartate/methionine/tyrosine aminotransferase